MTIGLRFDESASGLLEGINDAGIETFSGDHLGSLAREQGQNSVDARAKSSNGPVEVRYELLRLAPSELPALEELREVISKVRAFWSEPGRNDKKAQSIADRALRVLKRPKISLLRISDRNTTGLRGSNDLMTGDWFALTKASGVSLKGEGKLGSFGIGKNVFWANSLLRMVFFSTHDIEDRWAFQGVAKWASFSLGKNKVSRAIGFYGDEEGFSPLLGQSFIPRFFRPDGIGTDIFVAGFEGEQTWEKELIAAFSENFFVAFNEDLLRVWIGEHELSAANISEVISGLAESEPKRFSDLRNFYDAFVSSEAREFCENFEMLGRVRLRLLLRDGARKRIAMFRGTGMKIFEKGHFRTPLEFAGVCLCEDKEGNEFLRGLEPPSHNDWQPERHDDTRAAKYVMRELFDWLRRCVGDLYPIQTSESLDIPDLEKYLPDEDEEEPFEAGQGKTEGDPRSQEVSLHGVTRQERASYDAGTEETDETMSGEGDEGEAGTDDGSGHGGQSNEGDGGDKGGGGGEPAEGTEVTRITYRIFRRPGTSSAYSMKAVLPGKGSYSIAVYAIGDDGMADLTQPRNPVNKTSNGIQQPLSVSGQNRIGKLQLQRASKVEIEFELLSHVPLTLTARFYNHA